MTEGFVLGPLVRRVVKASRAADPQMIAVEVMGEIEPEDFPVALLQALREVVRVEITRQRETLPGVVPVGLTGKARSAAVRHAWAKVLEGLERNAVGAWVHLREFTREDLLSAADFRVKLAADNQSKAEQYRHLADLMEQHGVRKLKEVPAAELAAALEDVAA